MLLLAGMIAVIMGCSAGSALVGKWKLEEGQPTYNNIEDMELLKDGTGIVDGVGISWKVDKGRVYFTASSLGAFAYDYKISGDILTLTEDGKSLTYKKSK